MNEQKWYATWIVWWEILKILETLQSDIDEFAANKLNLETFDEYPQLCQVRGSKLLRINGYSQKMDKSQRNQFNKSQVIVIYPVQVNYQWVSWGSEYPKYQIIYI